MRLTVIFAALLFIAASCWQTKTENSSSKTSVFDTGEGEALEKQLEVYYGDMSSRDWEKYRTHFWKQATITTVWKKPGDAVATVDVTAIEDFIIEAPFGPGSQPVFEERMTNSTIHVQGNIAEAWVEYDASFGKPDSLQKWSGTDVFTFLKHDGEWKIVSLVFESK